MNRFSASSAKKEWRTKLSSKYEKGRRPAPYFVASSNEILPGHARQASVRGLSHARAGGTLEDASHIGASSDGRFLILSMCDGVGSKPLSHDGANFFSKWIVEELSASLESVALNEIDWVQFGQWASHRFRLDYLPVEVTEGSSYPDDISEAQNLRIPGESLYGTTAEFIVVELAASSFTWVRLCGDGAIFSFDLKSRLSDLTPAAHDDIPDGSVDILPNWDVRPQVITGNLEVGGAMLICTDGFADAMRSGLHASRRLKKLLKRKDWSPAIAEAVLFEASWYSEDDLTFGLVWIS